MVLSTVHWTHAAPQAVIPVWETPDLTTGPSHNTQPNIPFIPIHVYISIASTGGVAGNHRGIEAQSHIFWSLLCMCSRRWGIYSFFPDERIMTRIPLCHVEQGLLWLGGKRQFGSTRQAHLFQFSGVTVLIPATAVAQVSLYKQSLYSFGCLPIMDQLMQTGSNNQSCLTHPYPILLHMHSSRQAKICAFILSTTLSFRLGRCEIMSWLLLTFSFGLSLIIVREEHTAQLINWINIWPLFHKLA